MADKKVTYKEPGKYFNPGMKKAAKEWEKSNGSGAKAPAKKPATPTKKK